MFHSNSPEGAQSPQLALVENGLAFPPPRLERRALLVSINTAAPLPEGAGQGPQVRTAGLVLQCGPGL